MKKILVLLFVFLFAFTVYAQEEAPLFEWNGTGMKNTEVFEVKSPWRIVWNVTKLACHAIIRIIRKSTKNYKNALTTTEIP